MALTKYRLQDIAEVVGGGTPSTLVEENYGGEIVWITPKDLSNQNSKFIEQGERSISDKGFNSCSAQMIPAYNILMSSRAPIGLLAINKVECCTNQGFKSLILNKSICDVDYIYYYLKHHFQEIEGLGTGTTFKEVSKGSLLHLGISIPPLEEQQIKARLLSCIDAKIALNRSINHNLEAMAKQLYDYWFLQFDFPDENGKPYKSSGGKMVWNKKLKREIPEGWECDFIKNIATTYSGGTPKSTNKEYYNNGTIAWINSGELNNTIITKASNYITESGLNNSSAKLYPDNSILVAMYGATAGKVSLLTFEACSNQAVCGVIPVMERMQYYVFLYLSSLYNQFITLSIGSARDNISQETIKNILIPIPTTEVLLIFENKVREIYQTIVEKNKQVNTLITLRDSLLPLLMNGQVSLNYDLSTD